MDLGIKGCWCSRVCVTDKRQRSALLFYLSLRWCHTEDCVLWHGGRCRRLDLCLRYTMAELKSQEHSGRIMRESIWTIPPFKKSIKIEGPVILVTFKWCKCRHWVKLSQDFFFFLNDKEDWIVLYEGGVLTPVLLNHPITMLGLFVFSPVRTCPIFHPKTGQNSVCCPDIAMEMSMSNVGRPDVLEHLFYLSDITVTEIGRKIWPRSHNFMQ